MTDKCHICKKSAEWKCRDCDEFVCEDCLVPFTLQNQIEDTVCTLCHEGNEARRSMACWDEEERQERVDKERKLRNLKRFQRYWRPENVKKRRIAREERKKAEQKHREDTMLKAVSLVNSWFK